MFKTSKKSIIFFLALVLSLSLIITGCGNQEKEEVNTNEKVEENVEKEEVSDSHYPVEIENYNFKGEKITQTFEKAPEKVIAVYQNSIETLLALGLEDHIVAASGLDHAVKDEYKEAFEKLNYLEEFAPDKETVVMLEPDFILSWYSLFSDKNLGEVDYWHEKGINTYISLNSGVVKEKTLENEYNDILNLGKIFNVEDKAEEIVFEIQEEVEKVKNHVKDQENKKTILIVEKMGDRIRSYGINTLGGDMVTSLGGELLSQEGAELSQEDILSLNPDVIFSVYMDREDEDVSTKSVEIFTNDPALKSLEAVKNQSVYSIPLGEMYSSGIRTIDGILTFAKGIYPELYN